MAAKSANPTRPGRCEGEERKKALSVALANIEKQFGKGAIMRMADGAEVEDIETVSTGSLGLDLALGVGGLPRGRIIEVFGPESSGKTTLSLQVIAEMQKIGGTCAFIDAEHALDVQYAQRLGVQLSDLLISQPDTGEQALEITDALVRSGSVDLIVVDSVAALTPKSEIEGDMGDALPGLQARLMSQALRKLTGSITKTKSMVIFINQIRMKIGGYGNPETTTGGNALKFYSSVRLDIRRIGAIKKGDEGIGNETRGKGSSRTRLRLRSSRQSSTSSTARAFPATARSSTLAPSSTCLRSPAPGTPTTASASARARRTCASSSSSIPTSAARSSRRSAK